MQVDQEVILLSLTHNTKSVRDSSLLSNRPQMQVNSDPKMKLWNLSILEIGCFFNLVCFKKPDLTFILSPFRVVDMPADAIFATFFDRNRFLIEPGSVQRYADPKEFNPR
jgi:hypothetical protein